MMKSEVQIEHEYDEAVAATVERNGKYPAMTYEEGVRDALGWALGQQEEAPITGDGD